MLKKRREEVRKKEAKSPDIPRTWPMSMRRGSIRSSPLPNEEGLLESVEDALKRIEDGPYGICEECGTPIPPQRLIAIPYAPCCVPCEEPMISVGRAADRESHEPK